MSGDHLAGQPVRVLIVDDHPMVRCGLRVFLEATDGMEISGEASSGEEAVRLCDELKPDVVLMDLVMPGMGGVAATREICAHNPDVSVIALTSFPEEDLVRQALQAGALSYILKSIGAGELEAAIRAAREGRPTLAPEAAQALIRSATRPSPPGHDLSRREREVLKLMASGMSNRRIAEHLFISPSTVDFHVSNILGKLDVTTRTQAVALAVQHGLIDRLAER